MLLVVIGDVDHGEHQNQKEYKEDYALEGGRSGGRLGT